MKFIKAFALITTFLLAGFLSFASLANNQSDISQLLKAEKAPKGIVFEVVGWSGEYLKQAFEKIDKYEAQLHKKFPKLKIAIVSHGSEQFSLTKDKKEEFAKTHTKIKHLIETDIPVYVCGNHSRLRGVDTKEFPEYLKIAKRGPLQIKHYQDLSYQLIVIE